MGSIALNIPVSGQPNSTQDPLVAGDFTTIQTVINGNLDTNNISPTAGILDTQLAPGASAVRRLLLQTTAGIGGATLSGDWVMYQNGLLQSGIGGTLFLPVWLGDSGLSSQPTDFQVAGKTAYGRIRACLCTNATAPGMTFTFGLYQLTGVGGGANLIAYTFGTALAGSTVAVTTPLASTFYGAESAQFALPAANPWALGVNLSNTTAASAVISMTAQLFAYNA